MKPFQPTPFRSHPLIRGGHLQTLISLSKTQSEPKDTRAQTIALPDGDAIVIHENKPDHWQPGDPVIAFNHGLSGCHGSPYMVRFANRFIRLGWKTYRMDMRGCGAAWALARNLSHAGRSEDVMAALARIAEDNPNSMICAAGVSLGGNQLLRAVGRVGKGIETKPAWWDRLHRLAAISPPLNLMRCSDNMQRLSRRPYNYYFIRQLLARAPKLVAQREDFQAITSNGFRPRTLRELDDQITGPLSGFADAAEYYDSASSHHVVDGNPVETLIVTADDDPIVPVACFQEQQEKLPESTQLLISRGGGHNGFIGPGRVPWVDGLIESWFLR